MALRPTGARIDVLRPLGNRTPGAIWKHLSEMGLPPNERDGVPFRPTVSRNVGVETGPPDGAKALRSATGSTAPTSSAHALHRADVLVGVGRPDHAPRDPRDRHQRHPAGRLSSATRIARRSSGGHRVPTASGWTVKLCDAEGQAIVSAPVANGSARFDLGALSPGSPAPSCVKLYDGQRLVDAAED